MSEELKKGIPKATVIGKQEFTADEKARHRRESEAILRKMGVLGNDEHIETYEVKD